MNVQVPDYWPLLDAYHQVREPLYRQIIADADLAPDALILDAGCGNGFYSWLMADILGSSARIVAVDRDPAVLKRQTSSSHIIYPCVSDIEQVGLRPRTFDVIWLCRTLFSARDPILWLRILATLLQPGGKLIVIENDLAHYPILSWSVEFERRIFAAHDQYLRHHHLGQTSLERFHAARHLPAWLGRIGLHHVFVHTYVSEDVAPMVDEVENYWKLLMAWLGNRIQPFLSPTDWQDYTRAFNPGSPNYLLRRFGFYCLELTTVAWGTTR